MYILRTFGNPTLQWRIHPITHTNFHVNLRVGLAASHVCSPLPILWAVEDLCATKLDILKCGDTQVLSLVKQVLTISVLQVFFPSLNWTWQLSEHPAVNLVNPQNLRRFSSSKDPTDPDSSLEGNLLHSELERSTIFLIGNPTVSMTIFNSKLQQMTGRSTNAAVLANWVVPCWVELQPILPEGLGEPGGGRKNHQGMGVVKWF